ncbi:TonB-dependent receptor, partial [Novosphingobium sp. Rr 2-17]|uniref:TonB-dependent receptor domain-containing protein n=1 Tax=Novosphingobium sp. Rr 2-17 TaxID=555793 RepID=UPI0002699235
GARSLGEALRNIPGIRAEYAGGEGNASYSIRGLPLASSGSKFLQLQEDGMPVLEFGDMQTFAPDMYMRFDLNVAQIEAIRGGSASTFASNSPGGVINLLSKTGDVEGGSVQTTLGLNYGEHRIDADYGHKISDTLRFHIGGFYRQGEGPRTVGYDAYKGGQIKLNVTKTFANGFVRVYGKYLDDRTPSYQQIPLMVSGTDAKPIFTSIPGVDIKTGSLLSPNIVKLDALNDPKNANRDTVRDGQHSVVKSVGFDAQFDFGGWTVSEKFRFADITGGNISVIPLLTSSATAMAVVNGGPGATLSYATGPLAGQTIANPSTLNGNGLLMSALDTNDTANSLRNITNDLRVSRVWKVGKGDLTVTAGFYKSSQNYNSDWAFLNLLSDVNGEGHAALVDIKTAAGVAVTKDGYISLGDGSEFHRKHDVNYAINAPYGSINYHIGKLAIGGSVRYDMGKVKGTVSGTGLPYTGTGPGKVDYDYHYLSYSGGVNFRIAEPLAVFGRYSRGGRAAADRILFSQAIDYATGSLRDSSLGFDEVTQSELGLKFRHSGVTVNVTGFSAKTSEHNVQVNSAADGTLRVENIIRGYRAKGVELEAGVRRGIFGLTVGGTYTSAKIGSDPLHPELLDNTPRHQASLIFEATPQVETEHLTVGANFIGTTSSYAQDVNQLKLPGYTLVNAFVQVRPIARVQLMANINNLFNKLAFAEIAQGTIPAGGVVLGRAYAGRTVSATARYSF